MVLCLLSCYDGIQDAYDKAEGYSLRDRGPAGGWIFYINPNYRADGWRYMEAAPLDQSAGQFWINSGTSPDPDSTLNGKTSSALGTGWSNTEAIIAQEGHTDSAAKLCRDYRGGGCDDWFLPSREELRQMCWNLRGKMDSTYNPDVPDAYGAGVGDFNTSSGVYLSSTETGQNTAFAQFFSSTCTWTNVGKSDGGAKVRAARRF